MALISTWKQLISSDLPLGGDEIDLNMIDVHCAIITRCDDGLLRLNRGMVIYSLIHPVQANKNYPAEPMLVVQKGMVFLFHDGMTVFPDAYRPQYTLAEPLGLTGNNHDLNVKSVLVSIGKLDQVKFTPMEDWERELF